MCSLARRPCTRLWLYVSSLVPGCRTALRVRPRMRSLAWWPCTRLVLSNTLPPPAMQDSTRARISTLSSKEKESIQTHIADKIIALRLKQADVSPNYLLFSTSSPPYSSAAPYEHTETRHSSRRLNPDPSVIAAPTPCAPNAQSQHHRLRGVPPDESQPGRLLSSTQGLSQLPCACMACCKWQSPQALQSNADPIR